MSGTLRFRDFEFDPQTGELTGPDGVRLLPEKPAVALRVLTQSAGEVVTRETLQSQLWGQDTFVDFDNNLHAVIKKLRDALGDSASQPVYIETLPRKGYRFLPQVLVVAPPAASPIPTAPSTPAPRLKRSRLWPFVGMAVLMVLLLTWFAPSWEHPAALPNGRVMLAVLPFENLSGDPARDYLCDGLTEELIVHLSRLEPERLGVIARISAMHYRGQTADAAAMGRELGVHYLLVGGVRADESHLRVTVRLVQVSDQTHLWSERYQFPMGDLLKIQDLVSQRVAGSLAVKLLEGRSQAVARAKLSDTQAYRAYLKGRHAWNQFTADGYRTAMDHFQQVIALAPDAAIAHAALADAHNLAAFAEPATRAAHFQAAEEAARRALTLEPACAEAHNALAFALLYGSRDFTAADVAFHEAVDLNPGYAMAWHWVAGLLSATGRHEEAVNAVKRALELDPVSLSLRSDLGWYLLFADRPEEAVNACKATLALNPDYNWAESGLAEAYAQLGLWRQAQHHRRKVLQRMGVPESDLKTMDNPDPNEGYLAGWRLLLQRSQAAEAEGRDVSALERAISHAALGEADQAFQWLEAAGDDPWLIFLRVDPRFDPLQADPRFEPLASRLGL